MKTGQTVSNNGVITLTVNENWDGGRRDETTTDSREPIAYRDTTPGRWWANITITVWAAVAFVLVTQAGFVIAQTRQPSQPTVPSANEIDKMITGLGSEDFLLRQRSSEQLLKAGSVAITPLRAAQNSVDQEVRYRATEIVKKLIETDLEERARRFLAMPPTSDEDCGFQYWNTFSQFAGSSRAARSLLVAIHSNPQSEKLLEQIDPNGKSSVDSVDKEKAKPFNDQSVTSSVTVYAAEMYRRSMQPHSNVAGRKSPLAGSGVLEERSACAFESSFLSLSPITVQKDEHEPAFLSLLTAWLKHELQTTPMTIAKLKIISTYRLKAFEDDLADVLNQPQYPHKQAAIESLGKIFSLVDDDDQSSLENGSGVLAAISQLKPFVLSNEVLTRLPQAKTQGPVEVTLGDFAFQLILNIQEKDPKDFGMSEAGGKLLLDRKSIFCFESREAASESVKKWLADIDESQSNTDQ